MPNYIPTQDGLKKYREECKRQTKEKIISAINDLKKAKKEININAVARESGVSTVTIYKYKDLANEIKGYRDNVSKNAIKKRNNVSLMQLQVINEGLQLKVEELQKENEWLKKRIEVQNGEIQELRILKLNFKGD